MKRVIFVLLCVVVAAFGLAFSAAAQTADEPLVLEPGQLVTGELTESQTEVFYTLTLTEGDVVVVDMRRAAESNLFSTGVEVTNPEGRPVANSTLGVTNDSNVVAFAAAMDGDYLIRATRGEFSTSTGSFVLRAQVLEPLPLEEDVRDTITNDTFDRFFLLPSDVLMEVTFEQLDGDFFPNFRIQVADEDGVLRTLGSASALPEVEVEFTLEGDDALYIASVGATVSDYQFSDIDSAFEVYVALAEE